MRGGYHAWEGGCTTIDSSGVHERAAVLHLSRDRQREARRKMIVMILNEGFAQVVFGWHTYMMRSGKRGSGSPTDGCACLFFAEKYILSVATNVRRRDPAGDLFDVN